MTILFIPIRPNRSNNYIDSEISRLETKTIKKNTENLGTKNTKNDTIIKKLNALYAKFEIYDHAKYHNFYRFLSFKHNTTLKIISKISLNYAKISYFSHRFLSFKYYNFLRFLECKREKMSIEAEI